MIIATAFFGASAVKAHYSCNGLGGLMSLASNPIGLGGESGVIPIKLLRLYLVWYRRLTLT